MKLRRTEKNGANFWSIIQPHLKCVSTVYTTLWNVTVLKATTKNKTISVTTHLKKLTTGNNVFIVSVIL